MPPPKNHLETEDAAAFCDMSIRAFQWHLYERGDIQPDQKWRGRLYFKKATLTAFLGRKQEPGRPKGNPNESKSPCTATHTGTGGDG